MTDYLQGSWRRYHPRGPYGTNEGDIWTMEGSELGRRLAADGRLGIHEMLVKDGVLQEVIYNVELSNPDPEMQDLMKRAREGDDLYLAAQAEQN